MSIVTRALLILLGLVISAHVQVTLYVAGEPVRVAALWLILAVAAVIAAVAAWVACGVPRLGWPRLYWRTVIA